MKWGIFVHENLLKYFSHHKSFYAFEPINEPQVNPVFPILKEWYRMSRKLVQKYAPNAKFVFHNGNPAVQDNAAIWNDMFADDDMENVVMDIHVYQAFGQTFNHSWEVCQAYKENLIGNTRGVKYPIWVGEWSLATDICAQNLLGFNGGWDWKVPQHTCEKVKCPKSYLPKEFDTDFDRTVENILPYGGNYDAYGIHSGMCNSDSLNFDFKEVDEIAKCTKAVFNEYT